MQQLVSLIDIVPIPPRGRSATVRPSLPKVLSPVHSQIGVVTMADGYSHTQEPIHTLVWPDYLPGFARWILSLDSLPGFAPDSLAGFARCIR